MRLPVLLFSLLGLFVTFSAAWSKEDREIFRIKDELSAFQDNPDQSFYDLLGVKPSASIDDITKAYRKIIRSLHPDKVRQQIRHERAKAAERDPTASVKPPTQREIDAAVKTASERQARLSLVRNILNGPERDRYDFFLSHGFPAWKGTNYYYDRYRPGLGTAIVGVFVFAGGMVHWLFLRMSWSRQRDFVERYIKHARDQAWGDNLNIPGIDYSRDEKPAAEEDEDTPPPQPVNRRERRAREAAARREKGGSAAKGKKSARSGTATPQDAGDAAPSPSQAPTGPRKRVMAENGKVLVVDQAGSVWLEEYNSEGQAEHFLLDPEEFVKPTLKDTALVRLPAWFYNRTLGRVFGGGSSNDADDYEDDGAAIPQQQQQQLDSDNEPLQHTPTGSNDSAPEDFEMVEKSTESLAKAKASGSQSQASKASKRKNKKR